MSGTTETCWTMVEGAARGESAARDAFAHTYLPVVRSYLAARWRGGALAESIDDAVQDVFVTCLAADGPLSRVERDGSRRFRSWLHAVTVNIARRHEEKRARDARRTGDLDEHAVRARDATLSLVFDRAWARTLVRRAADRMRREASDDAKRMRRLEILELRFGAGLAIREIARRLDEDAARVHHDYARARDDFKRALRAEIAAHGGRSAREVEAECAEILARL